MTLDISRADYKANPFPHLARLEAQIAVNALLATFPDLRPAVAPNELRWRRGMVLRGLEALPVET